MPDLVENTPAKGGQAPIYRTTHPPKKDYKAAFLVAGAAALLFLIVAGLVAWRLVFVNGGISAQLHGATPTASPTRTLAPTKPAVTPVRTLAPTSPAVTPLWTLAPTSPAVTPLWTLAPTKPADTPLWVVAPGTPPSDIIAPPIVVPTRTGFPVLLPLLVNGPTVTPRPKPSRTPTMTSTPQPPTCVKPERGDSEFKGESGFDMIWVNCLSEADGELRLHGTVRLPKQKVADQHWEIEWAGDDVIAKVGLTPLDKQIKWFPADGKHHKKDAQGILTAWKLPENTNCRVWIRIIATAGLTREIRYWLFDLRPLDLKCVAR